MTLSKNKLVGTAVAALAALVMPLVTADVAHAYTYKGFSDYNRSYNWACSRPILLTSIPFSITDCTVVSGHYWQPVVIVTRNWNSGSSRAYVSTYVDRVVNRVITQDSACGGWFTSSMSRACFGATRYASSGQYVQGREHTNVQMYGVTYHYPYHYSPTVRIA